MKGLITLPNASLQYWINEYPDVPNVSTENLSENIQVSNNTFLLETKVALEIYLHKNASNYGLLGISYLPDTSKNNLQLNIRYVKENGTPYKSKISLFDKHIFCGLHEEYVPFLKNGIVELLNENPNITGGNLNVDVATNSEVGSSPKLFGIMSEIILNIIYNVNLNSSNNIDEEIKEIFLNSNLFVKS